MKGNPAGKPALPDTATVLCHGCLAHKARDYITDSRYIRAGNGYRAVYFCRKCVEGAKNFKKPLDAGK